MLLDVGETLARHYVRERQESIEVGTVKEGIVCGLGGFVLGPSFGQNFFRNKNG